MNRITKLTLAMMALLVSFTACKSSKQVAESTAVAEAEAPAVATPELKPVQVADEGTSLLWQISGNGLEQPSYLFGTIHIIGSNDFIFPESWTNAFNHSQHLMLELDMDDPGMMMKMMKGSMMEDGKSLKDLVSEEEYELVKAFFRDSLNQPLALLGKMKPMLLTSSMYTKMIEGDPMAYESELVKMAKERELEVTGVETIEDQLNMVDEIPLDEQIDMLMSYVVDFQIEKARFQEMIDLYVSQDLDALFSYMMDAPEMTDEAIEVMLNARNRKWIPVISEQAAAMPTFFAFGAGHLLGDGGVINLLRQAGYTVKPVK